MSVSDGHYNAKALVSRFATFFEFGEEWTQFGHTTVESTTFGFSRVGPRPAFGLTRA